MGRTRIEDVWGIVDFRRGAPTGNIRRLRSHCSTVPQSLLGGSIAKWKTSAFQACEKTPGDASSTAARGGQTRTEIREIDFKIRIYAYIEAYHRNTVASSVASWWSGTKRYEVDISKQTRRFFFSMESLATFSKGGKPKRLSDHIFQTTSLVMIGRRSVRINYMQQQYRNANRTTLDPRGKLSLSEAE